MSAPSLSVVVLSYNRPELLGPALASIRTQTLAPAETLVVDNPSARSDEIEGVVSADGGARLLRLHRNVGFAGGMNEGGRRASGELVFFTEDDLVLEPTCLERLVEALTSTPGASLVAPVMLNFSAGTVRCAGGRLTLGRAFDLEVYTTPRAAEPYAVNFVAGAAFCMRAREFAAVGGFRDDFFMYMEDCELCLRLVRWGRGVFVAPGAHVRHFEPVPGPVAAEVEFHKQKNLLMLYALHGSASLAARQWASCAADVVRQRGAARNLRARALRWNLGHVARLLRDRRRLASPCAAGPLEAV